jgi:nicotinamide mononucleotide transporter
LIVAAALGTILKQYTDASSPYIDALASTISLAANWLLARRKIDNWILWIVADMIYIGLFWYKELYLSSAIYAVFLLICIMGFFEWKKTVKDTGAVSS